MADLSHWDFAENFYGYDAAALILGFEPRESDIERWRIGVVTDRMELHYKNAVTRVFNEHSGSPIENLTYKGSIRIELWSVKLRDLHHRSQTLEEEDFLAQWLADRRIQKFESQEFERNSIAHWITQIDMKSIYRFDLEKPPIWNEKAEIDVDPADLPEELHAANIAFRAITNGYGEKTKTFKSRLIDYLENNFQTLNNEAIQRIATVANPDKGRGRKKIITE